MPEEKKVPLSEGAAFPAWKKGLFAFAGLLLISGAFLYFLGKAREAALTDASGLGTAGKHLLPAEPQPVSGRAKGPGTAWGPVLFRAGAGFFVGFAVGYALRFFLRAFLLGLGGALLFLAALNQLGWIEVNWPAVQAQIEHFVGYFQTQADSLQAFLAKALPLGGMTALGFFAGFRRG